VTTPWERELAYRAWREANAHVAVVVPADTAAKMRIRPRLIFFASALTIAGMSLAACLLYGTLPVSFFVLPVLIFASVLTIRFLFMREIANEISGKIARKIECRPEFEQALYKLVLSAPWSGYRVGGYRRGAMTTNSMQQVTTKFGETRTIEFADDLSSVIIGPEKWVDTEKPSLLEKLIERRRRSFK
jgi:hypothetical protein